MSQEEWTGYYGDNNYRTITYSYDADGNRATALLPGALGLGYAYNARNELSIVSNTSNGDSIATYGYDPSGNLTTRTFNNGTSSAFVPDALNRIKSITHQLVDKTKTLAYGYDVVSNRKYVLEKGDVILGDRGFCSYAAIASLAQRGVDSVMRLHQMRKADFRSGKALGKGERQVIWTKPAQRTPVWNATEFAALPERLVLRMIRLEVAAPGFRTRRVILITTLLDQELYPGEELRALYGQRWGVELHFHQLKTMLHLDILRCQSPALISKELQIHLIVYNLIRALMQKAAHRHDVPLGRISFKGTLDTLRQWSEVIHASSGQPRKQSLLISDMLRLIALDTLPHRPGRSEPRAKKRRPKTSIFSLDHDTKWATYPIETAQPKSSITLLNLMPFHTDPESPLFRFFHGLKSFCCN